MRRRVLLVSSSAEARAPYEEAAAAIDVDLVDDPSTLAVDGVLATDGPAALLAAAAARRLGRPWHSIEAVDTAADPLLARGRLMGVGLPVPWFFTMSADGTLASVADRVRFPCVIKPVVGRGAIRVDDGGAFEAALAGHRGQRQADSGHRGHRQEDSGHRTHRETQTATQTETLLVEAFVPGGEVVIQGVLTHGALHVLASIDVAERRGTRDEERRAGGMVAHAAAALGLGHGPIHAVCRINDHGVFILTLLPYPAGGRLASDLRFATLEGVTPAREGMTLPELLLRHASGEALDAYGREA